MSFKVRYFVSDPDIVNELGISYVSFDQWQIIEPFDKNCYMLISLLNLGINATSCML